MKLSVQEASIRHLRFMRASGENPRDIERKAKKLARDLGIDAEAAMREMKKPGETVGGQPYLAAAREQSWLGKAKRPS